MTQSPPVPQQPDYDVFLSYAHADNRGEHEGKVSALLEIIKEEHLRFTPDPLRVFFDTDDIRDLDDWEHRIYLGLRQSKVMLAVLSPSYFASVYCRKEWERYVQLELQRRHPGDGIAPIYVLEHPDFEKNSEGLEEWLKNLKRRQYVDIRHWWPEGQQSLQREDVRKRLAKLEQQVYERLRGLRAAGESTRQLPERYEKFVGRGEQLRQLKENLSFDSIRAITAVQGIGGIGKTALAIEYAYRYADIYPGGRYKIDCAGKTDVRADLVELAESFFGLALSESEKMQPDVAFRKARVKLEAAPLWLLILDNVDDPDILSVRKRNERLPSAENVHILATTRLEPDRIGGIGTLPLDSLTSEESLQLLFQYRPLLEGARESDEWHAALEIANRLGVHALAVQVVAVHLWQHPEISYVAFRHGLVRKGIGRKLDQAGRDAGSAGQIEHPETLIDALLEPTLDTLAPVERRVLEYAALLPPDNVPLSWLGDLVAQEIPDAWVHDPDDPDPWQLVVRRLEGLRLLVPEKGRLLARMHRIVQEVVRGRVEETAGMHSQLESRVNQHVLHRSRELERNWGRAGLAWEVLPLRDMLIRRLDAGEPDAIELTYRLHKPLLHIGRLADAQRTMQACLRLQETLLKQAPENADYARDLSVSYNKMGDLFRALGDGAQARAFYEKSLAVRERLAQAAPENADYARDLSVSFYLMSQITGESPEAGLDAAQWLLKCHAVLKGMRDRGMFLDPPMAQLLARLDQQFGS